ncbi:DinB family protein [Arcicella aurantiaca]|uniref:DinB family protein n=1 Tax=Arcicella aurantiaca TaxID=591202 RepID=UPI00286DACCF|nr:DinB family protein [Arcicella aurantiaca]
MAILYREIESYKSEDSLWIIKEEINNSGGNLALHLIGNLRTYIGKNLGNIPYIRNREAEFSSKNIPKQTVLTMIQEMTEIVLSTLSQINEERLAKIYEEEVLSYEMTTEYFLVHLHGHLTYHTGQINYHRRLLDSQIDYLLH